MTFSITANKTVIARDLGNGHSACPKCDSNDWKSAKLTVLEGTTFSEGSVAGTIREPGQFSGSLRAFLLSEFWFSRDSSFNAQIGLTTRSALVDEVKRFMVESWSKLEKPKRPARPSLGLFERINPVMPRKPIEPKISEVPSWRPWRYFFIRYFRKTIGLSLFGLIPILIFLPFVVPFYLAIAVVVSIISSFFGSFKGNEHLRAKYDSAVKNHPTVMKEYQRARREFPRKVEQHKEDLAAAREQRMRHEHALNKHKIDLKTYEMQVKELESAKEFLWAHGRVCTRCGVAYLGMF